MTLTRPLPGIRFEAQARPLDDVLPRMDIPVFAGFAASGPLHLPVAVEDAGALSMIFGGAIELPRPRGSREPRYAHLVPAVREFFRNGGRRCWVIRVADPATAVANSFLVPGLADASTLQPATAWARSEGSWSDALRVRTNLMPVPLTLRDAQIGVPSIDVEIATARDVAPGDLLRLSWSESDLALYLFVAALESFEPRVVRVTGTPQWIRPVEVSSPPGVKYVSEPAPLVVPAGDAAVERLTFDLSARLENGAPVRLTGLGFSPLHPRYFGALPSDALLYGSESGGDAEDDWTELWRDARTPRFPLAATLNDASYLPLGMTALFSEEAKPDLLTTSELIRDGLATFSANLFLDEHLHDTKLRDLLGQADALRYQAGLALTGIHAALGIEEVTMLSVPDAVHRGWEEDTVVPLASPLASSPVEHPELFRCWELHRSHESHESHESNGTNGTDGTDGTDRTNFFVPCTAIDPVEVPVLSATVPKGGTYDLTWTAPPNTPHELQEATLPDLSDAATIFLGSADKFKFIGRPAGDYFYRVRRLLDGRTSEWSNGVPVQVQSAVGYASLEKDDEEHPELETIHLAMLRMCAARADLVALLSLPRHYDDHLAITHSTLLTTRVAMEGEARTLSYGALWHPWLIGRDDDAGPLRAMPPDGATAGVMAKRAIARGAWVAPANEPLLGVVALTPEIPEHARQALQDAAVNLIRRDPGGFLCLDADTLSTDEEVRPLNVRRLLILVRRAALRTGNDYAFEPHSLNLRNTIKRGFESMLSSMYQRGAFAGRSAKAAYQVVTDETVNTPQSTDAGRLIAELKIAPSRPLSFLTIRLLQRGEGSSAEEVR